MNLRNITLAALLAMTAAGPASAIISSKDSAPSFQFTTVGGNINTHVSVNGTATLHGTVTNQFEANLAEREALKIAGVNRVVNLLTISENPKAAIASR